LVEKSALSLIQLQPSPQNRLETGLSAAEHEITQQKCVRVLRTLYPQTFLSSAAFPGLPIKIELRFLFTTTLEQTRTRVYGLPNTKNSVYPDGYMYPQGFESLETPIRLFFFSDFLLQVKHSDLYSTTLRRDPKLV
jgi:hypothetical protein